MVTKALTFLIIYLGGILVVQAQPDRNDASTSIKVTELKISLEPLLKMSLEEVKHSVPSESGLHFIGCPNCRGGAQDMGVLNWEPSLGSRVKCKYCSTIFPNEKFPYTGEKVITAPSGVKLKAVALAAQNYTDPAGWKGERFEKLDLISDVPFFERALPIRDEAPYPIHRF